MRKSIPLLILVLSCFACSSDSDPGEQETPVVLPTVTTGDISAITQNSANVALSIIDDGGGQITERGVVYNSSGNPTTSDNKVTVSTNTDSFTANLDNLNGNTEYFVRAFAINSAGTSYGEEKTFSTNAGLPSISTIQVSEITPNSAKSGGEITDDGGDEITARGVVWSLSANPTVDDNATVDGSGLGEYESNITELEPNTEYFVRAYAENSLGVMYGNEFNFTTSSIGPKVFEGDLVLQSQSEVNDFGNENYEIITGSLIIIGDSVVDLGPLSSLQKIGNQLGIGCENLLTLEGLENIQEVGSLTLNGNDALETTDDLESLVIIADNILVIGNFSLESLSGFRNIKELNGYFQLFGNQNLVSLDGLQNMERIGDYFRIQNNRSLENIDALANLKDIGGFLQISTTKLSNLNGFDNLETVGDRLDISVNENLLSIEFNKLTSVGSISIRQNDNIVSINGFNSLLQINSNLSISQHEVLESVLGFEKLEMVGEGLRISGGGNLQDLSGFMALKTIGGSLTIDDVEKMTNLNAFMNVTEIGMDLRIEGNGSLETLEGINSSMQIGGDIYMEFNRMLSDFCALQPVFLNGFTGSFTSRSNFPVVGPTLQDIVDGNCSF